MSQYNIAQALNQAITAFKESDRLGNTLWREHWKDYLDVLVKRLPSGGGFDSGTIIHIEKSKPDLLVLGTEFHHMNEVGYYSGWTAHTIRVRPGFHGLNITVSGSDKNNIKDYIHACFLTALTEKAPTIKEALQL